MVGGNPMRPPWRGYDALKAIMTDPFLFGAAYSVYARVVRLALVEKHVAYRLIEIDVFAPAGPPADYVQCHPFKRISAFGIKGYRLYETGAIARYVDNSFSRPALMPVGPRRRACFQQIISIVDNYAYRSMTVAVFME